MEHSKLLAEHKRKGASSNPAFIKPKVIEIDSLPRVQHLEVRIADLSFMNLKTVQKILTAKSHICSKQRSKYAALQRQW
jgi:hypothetical protein